MPAHLILGQGALHIQLSPQHDTLVCNPAQHNAMQDGTQAQAQLLYAKHLWLLHMGTCPSQEANKP
jgi:hypothetical protein